MNLIIEALFIGLYSSVLSLFLFLFPKINIYIYLFIIGFLKHLIGYYIGFHNYYCINNGKKSVLISNIIFKDSIKEGICFIMIGIIVIRLLNLNLFISIFITGFLFHIIAEYIHLHKYFIDYRCI
jgi:hypothetical protein